MLAHLENLIFMNLLCSYLSQVQLEVFKETHLPSQMSLQQGEVLFGSHQAPTRGQELVGGNRRRLNMKISILTFWYFKQHGRFFIRSL